MSESRTFEAGLVPMLKFIRKRHTLYYGIADFIMAMIAWALFFMYRKLLEGSPVDLSVLNDTNFSLGILIIPTGWVLLYSIFDQYTDIYRISRLNTLASTFFLSLIGVTFLFFSLILDDVVTDYRTYYRSFFALFLIHFGLTAVSRMILLTRASRKLKAGMVTFNTLLVGGNQNALDLFLDISSMKKGLGNKFLGFVDTNTRTQALKDHLPRLGKLEDIGNIIEEYDVEEVIIAIETSDHNRLREILNILFDYNDRVLVKIIPDMYDILLGSVKMNHVYGAVLIEIKQELMPRWQRAIKRTIDIVASALALL
ncbi:MAG: sugar transferase, partial [Bacteroidota bacterium]